MKVFVQHPKQDLHGLGYDPFKHAPEFRGQPLAWSKFYFCLPDILFEPCSNFLQKGKDNRPVITIGVEVEKLYQREKSSFLLTVWVLILLNILSWLKRTLLVVFGFTNFLVLWAIQMNFEFWMNRQLKLILATVKRPLSPCHVWKTWPYYFINLSRKSCSWLWDWSTWGTWCWRWGYLCFW